MSVIDYADVDNLAPESGKRNYFSAKEDRYAKLEGPDDELELKLAVPTIMKKTTHQGIQELFPDSAFDFIDCMGKGCPICKVVKKLEEKSVRLQEKGLEEKAKKLKEKIRNYTKVYIWLQVFVLDDERYKSNKVHAIKLTPSAFQKLKKEIERRGLSPNHDFKDWTKFPFIIRAEPRPSDKKKIGNYSINIHKKTKPEKPSEKEKLALSKSPEKGGPYPDSLIEGVKRSLEDYMKILEGRLERKRDKRESDDDDSRFEKVKSKKIKKSKKFKKSKK